MPLPSFVRDGVYRAVAENRYSILGRYLKEAMTMTIHPLHPSTTTYNPSPITLATPRYARSLTPPC